MISDRGASCPCDSAPSCGRGCILRGCLPFERCSVSTLQAVCAGSWKKLGPKTKSSKHLQAISGRQLDLTVSCGSCGSYVPGCRFQKDTGSLPRSYETSKLVLSKQLPIGSCGGADRDGPSDGRTLVLRARGLPFPCRSFTSSQLVTWDAQKVQEGLIVHSYLPAAHCRKNV